MIIRYVVLSLQLIHYALSTGYCQLVVQILRTGVVAYADDVQIDACIVSHVVSQLLYDGQTLLGQLALCIVEVEVEHVAIHRRSLLRQLSGVTLCALLALTYDDGVVVNDDSILSGTALSQILYLAIRSEVAYVVLMHSVHLDTQTQRDIEYTVVVLRCVRCLARESASVDIVLGEIRVVGTDTQRQRTVQVELGSNTGIDERQALIAVHAVRTVHAIGVDIRSGMSAIVGRVALRVVHVVLTALIPTGTTTHLGKQREDLLACFGEEEVDQVHR